MCRYIVDSHREGKKVGNPGDPATKKEGGLDPSKKEGGLDDALLFDILFANNVENNIANNVENKSPVKAATTEKEAKSPQVKAKETKKAPTKK